MATLAVTYAVMSGAFAVLCAPIMVAAARRTEAIWAVVLLTALGLGTGGVGWLAAWFAVFMLPRQPRAPR